VRAPQTRDVAARQRRGLDAQAQTHGARFIRRPATRRRRHYHRLSRARMDYRVVRRRFRARASSRTRGRARRTMGREGRMGTVTRRSSR